MALVSIKEASEILNVNPNTIRNLINAGTLPAYKIGTKLIRIKTEDIQNTLVLSKSVDEIEDEA